MTKGRTKSSPATIKVPKVKKTKNSILRGDCNQIINGTRSLMFRKFKIEGIESYSRDMIAKWFQDQNVWWSREMFLRLVSMKKKIS